MYKSLEKVPVKMVLARLYSPEVSCLNLIMEISYASMKKDKQRDQPDLEIAVQ